MMLKPSDTALFEAGAAPAEADREARATAARSDAARGSDRQDLLQAPRLLPGASDPRAAPREHTLSLTSAYGDVLASEQVSPGEFASALRRFYNHAIQHANAVVVLDGITQTRNSFLEFVRAFNDCAVRCAQLQAR